jgi:hypothetical protein
MKKSNLDRLIIRKLGSKAALLRAMQLTSTPISRRAMFYYMKDANTLNVIQLVNLSRVLSVDIEELINTITIKHEGDE